MQKEYTAKEILLGLRNECLKVQAKLDEVDNFLDYDRDKYKIETYLLGTNIESYLLKICPKKETAINKITAALNYPTFRLSRVSKQMDGIYGLPDFVASKVTINPSKRYEFDNFIREVINCNYLKVLNDEKITSLKVSPTYLTMDVKKVAFFSYWSEGDSIEFVDCKRKLTVTSIFDMLNYKIDSDLLTEDARKIINNNPNTSKELVLKQERFKHNEVFNFIENDKTLVLKREGKTVF